MYSELNINPEKRLVGDCVIRAIGVVDGVYFDTTDTGDEVPQYYFEKENKQ